MPRRRSSGEAAGAVPDHLRCRRTDGRRWRCPMRAMAEFNFCEHHYLLVRRNMARHKAAAEISEPRGDPGSASCDAEELSDRPDGDQLSKNGEAAPEDELIAAAVGKQIEKKDEKEKKKKNGAMASSEGREVAEVTRDLPNGVMTISPAAKRARRNADSPVDRKLGLEQGPFLRRRIRSKNAELVPISTLKRFPCSKGSGTRKKRVCHQCGDRKGTKMVRCSSCRKRFFCSNCIRCCDMTEMEAKDACPVCRGNCNCITCRQAEASEDGHKDLLGNQSKCGRMKQMHCLISQLFPVLRQINQRQLNELEIEAKCQGRRFSHIELQVVKRSENELANCNICEIPLNFHRCCLKCSFRLCLSCCGDLRKSKPSDMASTLTQRPCKKRKTSKLPNKELNGVKKTLPRRLWPDDLPLSMVLCNEMKSEWSFCCPSKELGGCCGGLLKLMVFLPFSLSKELGMATNTV